MQRVCMNFARSENRNGRTGGEMMRYGFMQRTMWVVFNSSYKKAIKIVLDENDADDVMKRAKKKYRDILNHVNEFDKESRFLTNILSCAMLSAVLLSIEKTYDVETIRVYYKTAMDNKIMHMAVVSEKNYTEKGRKKLKASAEKSQSITNPYDWKFTVKDGETINQYTATFYTCGICTLMNKLGLSEYIPAMCAFDYDMAEMNNTKFTREFTLATGGPYCDCHYDHSK